MTPSQTIYVDPDRPETNLIDNQTSMPRSDDHSRTIARALQIATILQTSLDVEEVIRLFHRETRQIVEYDGLTYEYQDENIRQILGQPGPYANNYRLVVRGKTVGQLIFSRAAEFSRKESISLEYMLCALVYPLLNSLRYREALSSALKDPLTGINNRAAMEQEMCREVDLAQRHGRELSLLMLDLDDFKRINDTFGHDVGDQIIKDVVECIAQSARNTDVVSRYGGEEFTVLLNSTGQAGAMALAERIRLSVEQRVWNIEDRQIKMTVSIGVACLQADQSDSQLLKRADLALYDAKHRGRNRVALAEQDK